MELYELTAHELKDKLNKNEIKVTEIVESCISRIKKKEDTIKAFISVNQEEVLEKAKELDNKGIKSIPIAIKDNICIKGTKTTCASKMLENFVSPYDATVIEKLNKENVITIGKCNLDEFAMGASTENSAFFKTRNPWNINKVPGGSSGGSTAAVAADMAPWSLGSDTGGSIRQPSSFCGLVGLKPTYGLVSRYGLVAFASSLDQIGPITKDVTDSAMLLNMISGYDKRDSTSMNIEKKDYTKYLKGDVKGLKIGIPKQYFGEGISKEIKEAVLEVAKKYQELGAIVEECSVEALDYALPTYYIISGAEASSNLGRFDGIRYGYRTEKFDNLKDIYKNSRSEGFGPEVKRRIITGTYVLSSGYYDAYYKKASLVRSLVKKGFAEQFKKYDVLLTPTTPTTAYDIGRKVENPVEIYAADICTVSVNIAGLPAMSIPCSLDKEGLPIGFQLIGNHFDEEKLIQAAYTYEQNTNFRENKPEFKGGM